MEIKKLFELGDERYAAFQAKLVPTIRKELIIGVRVPELRKLAKQLINEEGYIDFLKELPHRYYDENMLHSLIISELKDYDRCVLLLEDFLPYIDNWAVCDSLSPRVFKKNKSGLIEKIKNWSSSEATYTIRFGLEMLMTHFLSEDFSPSYLDIACSVKSEEYYVNMMIAWFFATALAKQWDSTISYLETSKLSNWVHNKTIQKACESFRISDEQKKYLKTLKL